MLVVFAVLGIVLYDRATWWMEVVPVLFAAPFLVVTYWRFPLTVVLYVLICIHALVLIMGGVYTYARVLFGFWLQDWLDLERNPYDCIGHFMQGFVPALVVREILLRNKFVNGKGMFAFLCLCVAFVFSAVYEFVEWGAALALGQGVDEFLGMQGDPWDTQVDMFLVLFGVGISFVLLGPL